MNWRALISPGRNISAEEAKKYLKKQPSGSCQLLDVGQKGEYEEEHLPGAISIPLKELTSRFAELDKEKPTLVYCRTGVRSKAAVQLLQGCGFTDVCHIRGGINTWKGLTAHGSETQGMEFFISGEFDNAFQMAYRMEEGLKQFYLALADMVGPREQKDLLVHMAKFEDGHMAMLRHQYQEASRHADCSENASAMEGGFDKNTILAGYGADIETMEDIIHLGMMFETQAYDLYSRLARKTDNAETRKFYRKMAEEEKIHLGQLSRELDKIVAGLRPCKS